MAVQDTSLTPEERIEGISDRLDDLKDEVERVESRLVNRCRELEDSLNQETSDREHADTRLEDRVASLE